MKTFFNRVNTLFSVEKTDRTLAHITPVHTESNVLLKQCLQDKTLDEALDWLKRNSKEQDHSDVWHYSKHWASHKKALQQRLTQGTFSFQSVRDVEVKANDGSTEIREIRCAEDRLLLRAISQTLQPIFAQRIALECTHLKGRGGTKKAVEDSHAQLLKQPKAHVMKSDVKSYYASMDHYILHQQFCALLPQETELQRLLWCFLQRTVERGGNYREVEKGIPLGSSLSPLLAALYLSPLDALFSPNKSQAEPATDVENNTSQTDNSHFYRRYMDDWVIFCNNKWDLRRTVKQVYAVLHALKVEVALKKTYIGKASKGFDFLGKRVLPIGILPSAAALSRMQKNTERPLFRQKREQGASKKRIVRYWMKWALAMGLWFGGSTSAQEPALCYFAGLARFGETVNTCFCADTSGGEYISGVTRTPYGTAVNVKAVTDRRILGSFKVPGPEFLTSARSGQEYYCEWDGYEYSNPVMAGPSITVGRSDSLIGTRGSDTLEWGSAVGVEQSLTYTIYNFGDAKLVINNIKSSNLSNVFVREFSLRETIVPAAGYTLLKVDYTPTAVDAFSFKLHITSNDVYKRKYVITVSGTGFSIFQ